MKKSLFCQYTLVLILFVFVSTSVAEEITIPLSKPQNPCILKSALQYGGINVKGYQGKEVLLDTISKKEKERDWRRRSRNDKTKGLKRIPNLSMELRIAEENNLVIVKSSSHRSTDLHFMVPVKSSLDLSCHHNGNIIVDKIKGEIEAKNHHGSIKLTNISGTALASTHHGDVTVIFSDIHPKKSMSFTSYHGDIDITLPAKAKVTLKIKSDRGQIYTDFDVQLLPKTTKIKKDAGDKFSVKIERGVEGTLNGGGCEIFLKTYHGNIYIRKGN